LDGVLSERLGDAQLGELRLQLLLVRAVARDNDLVVRPEELRDVLGDLLEPGRRHDVLEPRRRSWIVP